jgi:hypothetical protein
MSVISSSPYIGPSFPHLLQGGGWSVIVGKLALSNDLA